MRAQTRHQLKQDKFAENVAETYSWAVEHRNKLIVGGVVLALAIASILGGWFYNSQQNQKAAEALGSALRIYNSPLMPEGGTSENGAVTFSTAAARARAAHKEFARIATDYGRTKSGRLARYFSGLTLMQLGDYAGAEMELKDVSGSNSDLASLAKMALAALYRDTGKTQQAVDLYKNLIERPTASVSKSAAQLALASVYETSQPLEAAKLYEQITKDAPESAAASLASAKLARER